MQNFQDYDNNQTPTPHKLSKFNADFNLHVDSRKLRQAARMLVAEQNVVAQDQAVETMQFWQEGKAAFYNYLDSVKTLGQDFKDAWHLAFEDAERKLVQQLNQSTEQTKEA